MNKLDDLINLMRNSKEINCKVQINREKSSKNYIINIEDIGIGNDYISIPVTDFDYIFLDIEKCWIFLEDSIATFRYPDFYVEIFFNF